MDLKEVYSPARPVQVGDVGKCYYCGCEAEKIDHVPPVRYLEFYLATSENTSFATVPCCKECDSFLENCRQGLLEERKRYVNDAISRKYRKALNIYERWSEEELAGMSADLKKSIRAGLSLGEEAYARLRYSGFEYEIDGNVFHARRKNVKKFTVFGEEFDSFRNALQYASRSYKININTLKDWLMLHNSDFDAALTAYFEHIEKENFEKEKKRLCTEFAQKYKRNKSFVQGAVTAYLEKYPELSIRQCLEKLYEDRIKGK